ncbi:damage-inducible protein DinB [Deinococcus sp. Arct2-2]|uniref:DinB family protein n=1 Tax=Deinococcus sp. Arct2-2 TaxID=2568653 RepID=UPI0010A456E0|nr:DinB family protein [Deinococcus sp. Arct2-2]THF71131.1 damage-inducible protein DinB [Deinococcus sp. Arct2-2]
MTQTESVPSLLTPAALLAHWQGHRRLTRRVIEAFPEDQLFSFSVGGMRPFGVMAWEMVTISTYLMNALHTDQWGAETMSREPKPQERTTLLAEWDALTARLDAELPGTSSVLLTTEKDLPFGRQTPTAAAFYMIDNEVHHRGQGYVYLRALGIEPPPFWER